MSRLAVDRPGRREAAVAGGAIRVVATMALAAAVSGCGGAATSGTDAQAPAFDQAAVIAAADRADGKEDHVVGKCAVCELAMDGSPEFVSSRSGSTFHLCSAHCKEIFDHDPVAVLRRLPSKRV